MYTIQYILKQVLDFKIIDNDIFIKNFQKKLFLNNEILIAESIYDLFLFNHQILFNSDSNGNIYDINTKILTSLEGLLILNINRTVSGNIIIIDAHTNSEIFVYNLNDNSRKKFNIRYNWESIFLADQKLFLYDKTRLALLPLSTVDDEWEIDLSDRTYMFNNQQQVGLIKQIIGLYKGQLLVWMGGDRLLSINSSTGKIEYEVQPFAQLLDVNNRPVCDFKNLYLDEKSGKILLLNKHFYFEIDILRGKAEQLQSYYSGNSYELGRLPNMPDPPTDIDFRKCFYADDYIYFIGGYTFVSNVIGAFDRRTNQIVWQETIYYREINTVNNLIDIQVSMGKIYLLDTEGTLRIYEKNQDI